MTNILYTIVIFPLAQLIELCFMLFARLFNEGMALIAVSVAVTLGTLPLYITAEKWQQTERAIQKRLKPKIDKIKAVFSGDEQYMILQAYYRQNHYHPVYALRNTVSLFIQIPFFIAAYAYLSQLEALRGTGFLFIADLGSPDALLHVRGMTINILPIVMTVLNCIAGAIYTKGLPVKEKIQLYGMAAVFFILLYNSPAALVLYWTMNNCFSLLKNILQKTKYAKLIVYILLCICAVSIDIYVLFFMNSGYFAKRLLVVVCCSSIFLVPIFALIIRRLRQKNAIFFNRGAVTQTYTFMFSSVILFLLAGLAIPLALIASSVQEFSFIEFYTSPFPFIVQTALQAAGFFLFWPTCIYFLFSRRVKNYLTIFFTILCTAALINTYIFPGSYGFLTISLGFSNPGFTSSFAVTMLQVLALLGLLVLCLYCLLCKNKKIIFAFQLIVVISLGCFTAVNTIKISRDFSEFAGLSTGTPQKAISSGNVPTPVYTLSSEGKNVLIIMLDRAISGYVPAIFEEKPELHETFSGFTWYPNCVSFGGITLFGVPPVFGGYEYTPVNLSKDSGNLLVEKHNEALLMLPKLFSDNNFSVTVTDPTWANYSWKPDLRPFSKYPEIHVENIIGKYSGDWLKKHSEAQVFPAARFLKSNLIRFSFFKFAPPFLRFFIYDDGKWLTKIGDGQANLSLATIDEYAALDMLPDITNITSTPSDTFTIMVNQLTHEPAFLEAPDYIPYREVKEYGTGPFAQEDDYHVNMAAFLLLGKWFAFLKEHDAYDNTRIIIAADHGWDIFSKFPNNIMLPNGKSLQSYNPLLIVKDFNAEGKLTIDDSFMTNADTPFLAVQNLINDPVNPFTKLPLKSQKDKGVTITTSDLWSPDHHSKNNFKIGKDEWLHIHDNIFDPANWK